MKKINVLFMVVCMLCLLAACGGGGGAAAAAGSMVFMDEILWIPDEVKEDNPRWAHVRVDRIWEGAFPDISRNEQLAYVVAECTVLDLLYDGRAAEYDKSGNPYPREGETCYVWFWTGTKAERQEAFRAALEQLDSVIVYGDGWQGIECVLNTEDGRRMAAEYGYTEENNVGFVIAPVIKVEESRTYANGRLLPIRDGKVAAAWMGREVGGGHFRGWGYFDDGTEVEIALANIRRYVQEQLASELTGYAAYRAEVGRQEACRRLLSVSIVALVTLIAGGGYCIVRKKRRR